MGSPTLVTELAQFIDPKVRPDLRSLAITHLIGTGTTGDSHEIFISENFKITKALVNVFDKVKEERVNIMTIFINLTAASGVVAKHLINNTELPLMAINCIKSREPLAALSSKLLSNLSHHYPENIYEKFNNHWSDFLTHVLDMLLKKDMEECTDFLGLVLINFSQLQSFRGILTHKALSQLFPLLKQSEQPKRRLMAIDIMRNLSFDDNLHGKLLEESDDFLAAILSLITDECYELDDDEQAKLPLDLQYYEGKRVNDEIIEEKIVETLYQLCATKVGRNTLRSKGVYPLLREFDKATSDSNVKLKMADQENTLHALIGVLIRYEEEMEIPNDLYSIRNLE
uniref:Protein HGH1 homolog n=1 Tax=Strongyloides papillosus TaxID=174720 RepID=A0A0N5CGR5_STREA